MKFSEKIFIKQFKILNLISLILIMVLSAFITYNISILNLNKKNIEEIKTISYLLSKNPLVIDTLEKQKYNPLLTDYLDHIIIYNPKIDSITLEDYGGTRFYHIEKTKIGSKSDLILLEGLKKNNSSFFENFKGELGLQKISFTKIYDRNGIPIGFVSVSALNENLNFSFEELALTFGFLLLCILIFGGLILNLKLSLIKKFLLGYNPSDFKENFLIRNNVLDSIDEGILSTNLRGEITFLNKTAKKLIDFHGSFYKKNVDTIFPEANISKIIKTETPEINEEIFLKGKYMLITRLPVFENNKISGIIVLIKNKTEMIKLAEDLTGSNHLLNALRANTHEFKNKMHVILGLLELKDTKAAIDYISSINNSTTNFGFIIKVIQNKILAALIFGKMNYAKECNINLILNKKSFLPNDNLFINNQDLVTIIGNLLENSIDSINLKNDSGDGDREINLFVSCSLKAFIISVDDTGVGIPDENINKIFQRGFSTKGKNRGVGLGLVKNIVDKYNGMINIDSEIDVGTSITIILKRI